MATITGPQATCAAAGIATAAAAQSGSQRPRTLVHVGASSSRPAVARTDSAKPGAAASPGSSSTSSSTAADSDGSAARRLPDTSAASPTSPMTAARRTLGDGRARTTKAASASEDTSGPPTSPSPSARLSSRAAPSTTATLVPETATRCVSPVTRNSSRSCGARRLTSPTTSPGSKPRSAAGSGSTAARRPARRLPATRWTAEGPPRTVGGPRAARTAAVLSCGPAGRSRPSTRTRWLGSSPSQCRSVDKTSTGTRSRVLLARASTRSARTGATTRSRAPDTARCGSSVTTTSSTTAAPSFASAASGLDVRTEVRAPSARPAAPAQTSTAARAGRDRSTASPSSPATAARPSRTGGGSPRPSQAVSQAATAGSARRRSNGALRSGSRDRRWLTRRPWTSARRTCSRRSPAPRGAGRRWRSGRARCATRRCAGPAPDRSRAARRAHPPRRR